MKKATILGILMGMVAGVIIGIVLALIFPANKDINALEDNVEMPIERENSPVKPIETPQTYNLVPLVETTKEPTINPSNNINNHANDETAGKGDGSEGIVQEPAPILNWPEPITNQNNPNDGLGEPESVPSVNPSEDTLVKIDQGGIDDGETVWTDFIPL